MLLSLTHRLERLVLRLRMVKHLAEIAHVKVLTAHGAIVAWQLIRLFLTLCGDQAG
ncbi:hypothetical protein X737_36875 [Mesorhizobium sp. L48C026A00]|nr:hypothetical protein X737_36875 [Mesorhizobium sp. L48C026A00]